MSQRLLVTRLEPQMTLKAAQVRHLHVVRAQLGQQFEVFDGRGHKGQARLVRLDTAKAVLELLKSAGKGPEVGSGLGQRGSEFPQPVTLGLALLKGDKLADVVRAVTELGASRIQLLITQHADAREIGEQKLLRLRRIAAEASRQSERSVIPEVLSPIALKQWFWSGPLWVAHPGATTALHTVLDWQHPLNFLTGPEGGLSEVEVEELLSRGAQTVTLGQRILRAETAPVALLGAVAAMGV